MLRWISASEGPQFKETIDEFDRAITAKGPSPIKDEVFL
jgi:coenzyme F420-reducing hydrogenase delta subunit